MTDLCSLTATELRRLVRAGDVSCAEVAGAHLRRIAEVDRTLGALVTVTADLALRQAARWDAARAAREELPPLAGVPVVLKDNLCTRGLRTTAGSRILGEWRPPYDATAVRLLAEAGTLLLGKANLDEFAMGSSTENSGLCITRNPWDLERVPGGSSGGSAAAVAARMTPLAAGSDTGGSVRQPAALCGVVGLKPTYGRVSRYGLIAYASSLDQIGPLARTVEDAALMLEVLAAHDPRDSTSAPVPGEAYAAALEGGVRGLRVGVPREYLAEGVQPEVRAAFQAALEVLEQLGAVVEECSTPHVEHALAAYYIIAPAEASSNLARYDGIRYGIRAASAGELLEMYETTRDEGFGAEVKHRILLGTYALSAGYYDAYYHKALQVRTLVRRELESCWERFDVLATPTSPEVAFPIGAKTSDPLAMKLADVCTIPVNMAGTCAISVPCGFGGPGSRLPVGLQLIGRPFGEAALLRAAHTYEQAAGWWRHAPGESAE
jgi:aspartyl-tRNA(Asn)/glutamyl-tRNA(Gln) amidotransferase subunit A